jgi:hypothetical protein
MEGNPEVLVGSPRKWDWYLRGRQQQQRRQQQQIPRQRRQHNCNWWRYKPQEAPEQRRLPQGAEQSLELQVDWQAS